MIDQKGVRCSMGFFDMFRKKDIPPPISLIDQLAAVRLEFIHPLLILFLFKKRAAHNASIPLSLSLLLSA